jgi:hypothetical protein
MSLGRRLRRAGHVVVVVAVVGAIATTVALTTGLDFRFGARDNGQSGNGGDPPRRPPG